MMTLDVRLAERFETLAFRAVLTCEGEEPAAAPYAVSQGWAIAPPPRQTGVMDTFSFDQRLCNNATSTFCPAPTGCVVQK